MKFKSVGSVLLTGALLSACASGGESSQAGSALTPRSSRVASLVALPRHSLGCYGAFKVRVEPCPAYLRKKNNGSVSVTVSGPGVVLAVVLASDCAGSGSVCNIAQTGNTEFDVWSTPGENECGTAYVVFEGLTASESPIGTATLKVRNKYC